MNSIRLLYLATNVFDKGGIQRYSRVQIQTLSEIFGINNINTFSLRPASDNCFEEPFEVGYVGKGKPLVNRMRFSSKVIIESLHTRPNVIWTNHIKLLPLALFTSRLTGGIPTVGNVYGLEVWSGLRISELFSLKKATKVVSDCHSTAAFIGSLGVGSERISVIWDPVDVRRFFPKDTKQKILKKYGIPYHSKNCYLMTLGRISKTSRHKGYDRIIDVISSIDRDDLVYLIVGDGDDKRRLEERVIKEGLSQRIFLLGSVPEYELSDVYNGADIFVLVSDRGPGRGEGVPLTPLEAAACGKPIIVGNEDGSREAIIDGESGFIVSPRDLNSIRQAILRLVDNKELRENMGHSARLRVKREFSKEVFKSRTENLVESIF